MGWARGSIWRCDCGSSGSSPAWPNPGGAQSATSPGAGTLLSTAAPVSSAVYGSTGGSESTRSRSRTSTWITGATSSPGPGSRPTAPTSSSARPCGFRPAGSTAPHVRVALGERGDVRARVRPPGVRASDAVYGGRPRIGRDVRHFDLGRTASASARTAVTCSPTRATRRGPGLDDLARGADLFLCEATLLSGDVERAARPPGGGRGDRRCRQPPLLTHRPVELPAPDGVEIARDGLVVEVHVRPGAG